MSPTFQIAGVDVFVEGEGEAETLVMIHGWPDTHRLWDAQVAHLQSSHRCVRFTLPGFDAAKPRRACGLGEMIALFKRIIERVSPGRPVVLMLHDWGCVFGYQLLMRHPELVSRVIGVDILYGTRKPFMFHSQAWADALAAKPGSRVQGFKTGHWVMSAQPQAFNEAVAAWLAPTAQTSSSASSS